MAASDLAIAVMLLLQTTFGIWGNFSLLCHYIFFYSTGYRLKSTDLILTYLTIANFLVIASKGIPQTMAAFGLKNFLNDFGCKLVFYIHKVSRNMSISTACLLSIFQAIKISHRNSRLAYLKVLSHKFLMIWASGSMVLTLYGHKKQVQHIRSKNLSPRSSPEKGVAQSIIYLPNEQPPLGPGAPELEAYF
ncbi:vomeronasal type-1 receptor 4-like [Tamandua tetradactyla]|uniref:vomeronasal type-1 receptor 4-like n=1 Tax=Tamandua tetradactyla TaxID=48850 RepID=UPI00405420C1